MPIGWPAPAVASGVTLSWGTTQIIATAISYNRQALGEIDLTSMESAVINDPNNTNRKLIKKSVEFGVIDHGELSVEFFGPGGFNDTHIGTKRTLSLSGSGTGFSVAPGGIGIIGSAVENGPNGVEAFLTACSVQASAGELVRGTCTFRLSDT